MKDSISAVENIKNVLNEELKILQSCEDGRSFLYNSKKLIGKLRSHPRLKGFISELETKNMECRAVSAL